MRLLASIEVSAGVMSTESDVETAVMDTESGTSARAR